MQHLMAKRAYHMQVAAAAGRGLSYWQFFLRRLPASAVGDKFFATTWYLRRGSASPLLLRTEAGISA